MSIRSVSTSSSSPSSRRPVPIVRLDDPITRLKGAGPLTAARLAARGLCRIGDLPRWLPLGYDDFRRVVSALDLAGIPTGGMILVRGKVVRVRPFFRRLLDVHLEESGFGFRSRWFRPHQGLAKSFVKGMVVALAGRLHRQADGTVDILQPAIVTDELGDGSGLGIVPRYPRIEKIPGKLLRSLILSAVAISETQAEDLLPSATRERLALPGIVEAFRSIHRPSATVDDEAMLRLREGRSTGHRRLLFDQVLRGQLLALRARQSLSLLPGWPCPVQPEVFASALTRSVPFALTEGQTRVIQTLATSLAGRSPMSHLLVGDVGSGKTVVAFAALAQVALAGGQSLFMAPTTILAEQHHRTLSEWAGRLGFSVGLLHGGIGAGERNRILAAMAEGSLPILVGTHALLNESISPRRFALAVVDEQHRFGVRQRLALRRLDLWKNEWKSGGDGGMVPHLLVMSATPIPRSMALALHGDLDLLTLPDKPKGRQPIRTSVGRTEVEQEQVFARLRAIAMDAGQGFVVCPAIEAGEGNDRASIKRIARILRDRLAPATLALVHGQLPKDEAERTVAAFARGEIHVLLATTVLEVGVDVPAARIMVVMDADRFGLAQLHQLRGRVGRGSIASECHLLTSASDPEVLSRLSFLAATHDGFKIAEEDLRQRGAGDPLGERQSGDSPFSGINGVGFGTLVEEAHQEATAMLERDPSLFEANHPIGSELDQLFGAMSSTEEAG